MKGAAVTAIAKEEFCGEQDYSEGPNEIGAAVAACREGNRSAEQDLLRLFREVRTAYVESMPAPERPRTQLAETERGITDHHRSYEAYHHAVQCLSAFCRAFDEHPDVHLHLEPELKAIVQATAKERKNGAPKRQASRRSDVIDWCTGKKNDRSAR